MARPVTIFALVTLGAVLSLFIGALMGGAWAWLAFLYMTAFTFAMDELVRFAATDPGAPEGQEFPAATRLSVALAVLHFLCLIVAVATISGITGLSPAARIALFLGFGMFFGQVSNSNAHELIHRSDRGLFRLGMWVYISLLFGHHTSAHRHIHHRHVATQSDPNSAEPGESFYQFLPRAWVGSFTAGREIETALRKRARDGARRGLHPYLVYLAGSAGFVLVMFVLFGVAGLIAYLLLAVYAQVQLLLSDYVQHYGLERHLLPDGRMEPVSDRHSWNSGRWFSAALMLNAPLHSAHHAHPARPYPELTLPPAAEAPRLPYSLPIMATIALIPSRWFRLMDPRLQRWNAGPR